jgi:hypothetical protein
VTRHHTFQTPATTAFAQQGTVTLVTKTTTSSLLATCRTINNEASRILTSQLDRLRAEPLRLIVDSFATSFCRAHNGLLSRLDALAAEVVTVPNPMPCIFPYSPTGTPLDNFTDKCVSYLSYGASVSSPASQARDIVITLTTSPGQPDASDYLLDSYMLIHMIEIGIARFVGSVGVIHKPGSDVTRTEHDLFQRYLVRRALQSMAEPWRSEEQWREEWDEGEEL